MVWSEIWDKFHSKPCYYIYKLCMCDIVLHTLQVLYISDVVNRPEYIPRNPTFENLPNVFDVRFSQVQPYLHRVMLHVYQYRA